MTAAKIRKVHKQHHVARFYLDAWATNGQLSCLRDNRIFSTNVRDAAVERHFYRGRRLTPNEKGSTSSNHLGSFGTLLIEPSSIEDCRCTQREYDWWLPSIQEFLKERARKSASSGE